jgi:hypothetical protein
MREPDRRQHGGPGRGQAAVAAVICAAALLVAPLAANGQTTGGPRAGMAGDRSGLPSENTAVALGAVGVLAGVFLPLVASDPGNGWGLLTAWCMGPSLGFFYGGCWGRGLLTTGLRFGLIFVLALAAYEEDNFSGVGSLWLGGMAATAILDLATTRRAVRNRNARIMARRGLRLDVAPVVLRRGAGIKLQMSF